MEQFKKALKDFLHMHSFYTTDEFFICKINKQLYLNLVPFYKFLLIIFYYLYAFYVNIIIVIVIIEMYSNSLYW